MSMIKRIFKNIWKPKSQEEMFTPKNVVATFQLTYRKLEIGTLSLKGGKWTFRYAEAFKAQDKIKPLTDFPDVNKVYTSGELYPFFLSRIPGARQPRFQEIVKREHINPKNEAELLKRFGGQTIANSFVLQNV
jgi:HipA-like protein